MGFLHQLWDETLAGPAPESGLDKLRKYDSFPASRSAPVAAPPGVPINITRSITVLKSNNNGNGYKSSNPRFVRNVSVENAGCSSPVSSTPGTPTSPMTPPADFKKFTRREAPAGPYQHAGPRSLTVYDWRRRRRRKMTMFTVYLTSCRLRHIVEYDRTGKSNPSMETDEDYSGSNESLSGYDSDDYDDSSFEILEGALSELSVKRKKKKGKLAAFEDSDSSDGEGAVEADVAIPELDEEDQKSLESVLKIIQDGEIEKLKVDQCKVYLRKNGLRLTGNKATLIQRIKEHLEIIHGGGEKKYPVSSFVMNCKGDACTGDVVMFEQNVYDQFNLASRRGPPTGRRIIVGRIIKESYGAAKQQHTFTIEVLWSKGDNPLPPLHPLLVKGRNLYRFNTMRQKWQDEAKRQNILTEKHCRGSLARSDREIRLWEKGQRKALKTKSLPRKEKEKNQAHSNSTLSMKNDAVESSKAGSSINKVLLHQQGRETHHLQAPKSGLSTSNSVRSVGHSQHPFILLGQQGRNNCVNMMNGAVESSESGSSINNVLLHQQGRESHHCQAPKSDLSVTNSVRSVGHTQNPFIMLGQQGRYNCANMMNGIVESSKSGSSINNVMLHQQGRETHHFQAPKSGLSVINLVRSAGHTQHSYILLGQQGRNNCANMMNEVRRPLGNINQCPRAQMQGQRDGVKRQVLCRYFDEGRCRFGDNCKFLHAHRRANLQEKPEVLR
ncbi:hypothetical protein SAY87_017081 [Trapa incisa]|uniref:Zinc finger CCCH domain-containing protein 62 n=1 Tax=Trapa incisa TaxID=236973 RepID=A0AAN7L9R3_9MYRT|nr:hypothetical protein SAY87_017081 [Trapa incisa]